MIVFRPRINFIAIPFGQDILSKRIVRFIKQQIHFIVMCVILSATPLSITSLSSAAQVSPVSPVISSNSSEFIVVTVNGEPLTQRDVTARERLYAISTGVSIKPESLTRLRPQITRQLIDERLRMQEMNRRHIIVPTEQIAQAIHGIEQRNNMASHSLRDQLAKNGISLTTLIDQIRTQIGWMQILREELGDRGRITASDLTQREDSIKRAVGRPEYLVNEIFISVEKPSYSNDILKATETIIDQLRNGAPFPIVAAQFSQSRSALEGGSLGWIQDNNLDPAVLDVVQRMPVGAISNPVRVPGGYDIIMLGGKRTVGIEIGTELNIRQIFLPFSSPLDPHNPTPQQNEVLAKAISLGQSIHSCQEMEKENKKLGEIHPSNPGVLQFERLVPVMQDLIKQLPYNKVSHPLVSPDGINLLMVCSRQKKNLAQQTPSDVASQLLNERVEQVSQRLDRDLRRQAVIIRPRIE